MSADKGAVRGPWGVKLLQNTQQDALCLIPGKVGWGGNGGWHVLNLAVQLRPRKVLLVGYDMRVDLGAHWHGPHPSGMNNPIAQNVERWRRCIDAGAAKIADLGVEVINCSAVSALQNYRKLDFREALAC